MTTMRGYLAMTHSEFRLFRREPFSVVFVIAFPLMMMMLLAAVFGDKQADAHKIQNGMLIWRGVTPANYYTAASVAGIVAALGLMTLPITLASYRERGILRRFRASSVSASTLVSAQLTLMFITFVAGTLVMAVVARLAYHAMVPQDVIGVIVALLAGTAAFGAIGLLLAAVIRTSRSAQGIGLLLFFALWLISGTAPPRAVLPNGLRDFGGLLPLAHLVTAVQNPWFGFGWSGTDLAVLAAYAVVAGVPALWLFRRGLSDTSGRAGMLLHSAGDSRPHETGGVIGGQNHERPGPAITLSRRYEHLFGPNGIGASMPQWSFGPTAVDEVGKPCT